MFQKKYIKSLESNIDKLTDRVYALEEKTNYPHGSVRPSLFGGWYYVYVYENKVQNIILDKGETYTEFAIRENNDTIVLFVKVKSKEENKGVNSIKVFGILKGSVRFPVDYMPNTDNLVWHEVGW